MKKTFILSACLLLFVLLSVFADKSYDRSYQEHPLKKILREKGMVTKKEGNLTFSFSKTLSPSEQKDLIARCKERIGKCLEFIGEPPFDDSIHLILVPTRNDMRFFFGVIEVLEVLSISRKTNLFPRNTNLTKI